MRSFLKLTVVAALALLVAVFAGAWWARARLHGSLPRLDGTLTVESLSAPVTIARDRLGIPTIRAATREDVAHALGFLHAQDRFFQMDLARRRAAGELSALVGPRALVADRESRIHRFRAEARRAVDLMSPGDRRLLDAYVAGVNNGLDALSAQPFEYDLLRQAPARWKPEDSFLVVLSMFLTLQDTDGAYESTLGTMHDVLPRAMFEFLAPRGTEWDAPIEGSSFATPPIPGPEIYNLRERRTGRQTSMSPDGGLGRASSALMREPFSLALEPWTPPSFHLRESYGSNNWAVSGALAEDGHALVANDMHLTIRVPSTWYRASMEWRDANPAAEPHRLIGTTLPGVPTLVTGSNTHIAWGFTNTWADFGDLVVLETDPTDSRRYRTVEGWQETRVFDEVIRVAGEADQHFEVVWTRWGPLVGSDHHGRLRAYSWAAHSAERLAASMFQLETARTIEEAFDAANRLGAPAQNLVIADRSERIGWSIYGSIPRRVRIDGTLPSSWADGSRGWNGWLEPSEYPRIVDPPDGRLWTANARVVSGEMLAKLGDGSYDVGARAHRIRDRLNASSHFTPREMLAIQMDADSTFLNRWRTLLLGVLTPAAVAKKPDRAELQRILSSEWRGQASPDSAAYRFVRVFRDAVVDRVGSFVVIECMEADPHFDYSNVRRREGPIWKLVTERPSHLLDPQYQSWDDLLLALVDGVLATARTSAGSLTDRTWSEVNVNAYRHPLSAGVPVLWRWLDMPTRPLAGDTFTPQVHWGSLAASVRMVVSPGHEAEGIMHMPTGQSGHPLSPFYANSHEAWVNGDATGFLPGHTEHTLSLVP